MKFRIILLAICCAMLCSCAKKGPMDLSQMRFLCSGTEEFACGPGDQGTICDTAAAAVSAGGFGSAHECAQACNKAVDQKLHSENITTCSYYSKGAKDACALYCRRNYPDQ